MRCHYPYIILVIISALTTLGCADFEVPVTDGPRDSSSETSQIVSQELSGEQANSTDGRASFISDLNEYQSLQSTTVIGRSKSLDFIEIHGIDLMGLNSNDTPTIFSFTTNEKKNHVSSAIITKPVEPKNKNVHGCGILTGGATRTIYPNKSLDQADIDKLGYFPTHPDDLATLELPSIEFSKPLSSILPTPHTTKVTLSGSTDTTIHDDMNFRIINNHIFRSEKDLFINIDKSDTLSGMVIDFYGSDESKSSLIRCIGKPNETLTMSIQMQQLIIPIKGIVVSEIQTITMDKATEVKVLRNIHQ